MKALDLFATEAPTGHNDDIAAVLKLTKDIRPYNSATNIQILFKFVWCFG